MVSPTDSPDAVALVGIGCRLPGGVTGPQSLWTLLDAGGDAIGPIPADRWDAERFYAPAWQRAGRMTAREGGFLNEVDGFDAAFFGIPRRVAEQMDPQQRLLLEVCWEAFEDAGIVPESLAGSRTGVFVGACSQDYANLQTAPEEVEGLGPHSATGMYVSILSNRLSYTFDLRGPSMTVDTACSSSLVAVDLAYRNLMSGEIDVAVAAGVNLMLSPQGAVALSQASMLSPLGRSRAFDASADGYVRGEGAGVVVLKRLSHALRDRDRVYAVIRGTAVNQDGRTQGITVPNGDAQEANARTALAVAGIRPRDVGYVEAHGTGTPVGDPIEAGALGRSLLTGREADRVVFVGSVKSNIGHLEGGAGIAGLIKAALAVHHRRIPAHLHFRQPHPELDLDRWRMAVPTASQPWPPYYERAIATINSFGFGGTNANVVIEEAPPAEAPIESRRADNPVVLTFSAQTEQSLRALTIAHAHMLRDRPVEVAQLAATLALRRSHHPHRLSVLATDAADAADRITRHHHDEAPAGVVSGRARGTSGRVAFLLNGQGPQWFAMGRSLLETSAVFREAVLECDALARQVVDWSILEALQAADEVSSPVEQTRYLQPMMFAVQVGLARLWESWGVVADGVVGHSMGEIAAAYLCGALDLATAVRVICLRARIQAGATPSGGMMFAATDVDRVRRACEAQPGQLWVSAENGPHGATLSGRRDALAKVIEEFTAEGIFTRLLRVNCACHSPDMDPLREDLLAELGRVGAKGASLDIYSTVTGGRLEGTELDESYWWRNFREPVLFAPAVRAMITDGYDTFVELSPHPVLNRFVEDLLAETDVDGRVVGSLTRGADDWTSLGESFGALYTGGAPIDWRRRHPGEAPVLDLPTTAWDHESFWNESAVSRQRRISGQTHPMLAPVDGPRPAWQVKWDDHRLNWVRDHDVFGSVIVPGAAFVEAALVAARQLTGEPCGLDYVEFERACVVSEDEPQLTRIELDAEEGTFECHSRPARRDTWVRSARGRFHRGRAQEAVLVDLAAVQARCPTVHQAIDVYSTLHRAGYAYGPALCGIRSLATGEDEVLARIGVPRVLRNQAADYLLHPAVLDACFQSAIVHPRQDGSGELRPLPCLLTGVDEVRLHEEVGLPAWCYSRIRTADSTGLKADLRLLDEQGRVLAEFLGLRGTVVPHTPAEEHLYELTWQRDRSFAPPRSAFTEGPEAVRTELAEFAAAQAQRLHRGTYAAEYGPAVRELCGRYIARCLHELGTDLAPGGVVGTPSEVTLPYQRAFAGFLGFLAEDGVLAEDGGILRVRRAPSTDIDALLTATLAEHPACAAELLLLDRTGRELSSIVTGRTDPLALLFPDGSPAETESIYQTSPATRFYDVLLTGAVRRLAATADPRRTVRVLEVGGGTGGLTLHVLPALPADRCEYVFTDISPAFLHHATNQFGHRPWFETRTLDLELDLAEQGVGPGSVDLVLASNVLHATADLGHTLARLRGALAPGGVLALLEAEPGSRWLELTFGLSGGWWLFRDAHRGDLGPLLAASDWERVCRSAGFEQVVCLGDPGHQGPGAQTVLLARAPDQPTPAEDPMQAGHWLLLGERDGLGAKLTTVLQRAGGQVTLVPAESAARLDELMYAMDEPGGVRGVVHLPDAPPDHEENGEALASRIARSCERLIASLQALDRIGTGVRLRTFVVTREQHALRGVVPRADQGPLWGVGLVAGLEQPQAQCTMIDLTAIAAPQEAEALGRELLHADDEREIALCGGERLVRRVRALPGRSGQPATPMGELPDTHAAVLVTDAPGTLDDLHYRVRPRTAPGPGEVEVEVAATGLNFLDVMTALGQVPPLESAPGHRFGAECAGVVTRVGPQTGATGLAPGDRVVAVTATGGALASHVVIPATGVLPLPPALGFEEAAAMPITHLTAWLALAKAARLSSGERILIHSAAGGTGMAASQVARHLGAEVIATAGTPEKRALLRAAGVAHVLDAAAPDFVEQVKAATGGAGVDVVLSATTGEAFTRSLACLAPYGRFVEIGKRNALTDTRLGMRRFLDNLTFISFDLRQLLHDRPEVVRAALQEVFALTSTGVLSPAPLRVFHPSQTEQALRHLAAAKHIGKVVVSMAERDAEAVGPVTAAPDGEPGTWLVTGGLSGFGLAAAESLARGGVRHLVLVGRSGASTAHARARVADMRARGVEVLVDSVDVCSSTAVDTLVDRISQQLPPLRGVLHCAMVLDDAPLTSLDRARVDGVIGPKVAGAWNLHRATEHLDLAEFVLFSSAASFIGNRGQAHYAAGNAFLDHLAHARRARGLPGLAVNWGVISDVGYVARHSEVARMVSATGMESLTSAEALAVLTRLRRGDRAQVGVLPVDWQRFVAHYDMDSGGQLRYEHLDVRTGGDTADAGGAAAGTLPADAAPHEVITARLTARVAEVLGMPVSALDKNMPLMGYLDSLLAVEIVSWIERELGVKVTIMELMNGPSIVELVEQLVSSQVGSAVRVG